MILTRPFTRLLQSSKTNNKVHYTFLRCCRFGIFDVRDAVQRGAGQRCPRRLQRHRRLQRRRQRKGEGGSCRARLKQVRELKDEVRLTVVKSSLGGFRIQYMGVSLSSPIFAPAQAESGKRGTTKSKPTKHTNP